MKNLNKIKGCLIGGAIGDSLGYPIEFTHTDGKIIKKELNRSDCISDDTQMTLFTANALLWQTTRTMSYGISPKISDCLHMAYQDWYETQQPKNARDNDRVKISWVMNVPEMNETRAPGVTCLNSLSGDTKGTIENPINNSKGCGGVMRVAPIGLYYDTMPLHEIGKIGAEAAAITHGHPLGIIPAYVFAALIHLLAYSEKNIEEATKEAVKDFHENFNKFNETDIKYFTELIDQAVNLAHEKIDDFEAISQLGEGWVAEEALAIAIYSSIKYQNNFEKAIVCSINHNGDSDSTGAIAGNIIGTYLGYDKIPNKYKDNIELKDVILEIAEDLYNDYKSENEDIDEVWEQKYIQKTYKKIL